MAATITLKSYNDSGSRDGVDGYWRIDFNVADDIGEEIDAQLDNSGMPMTTPDQSLIFDFTGPIKKISFSGERVDGDINNSVSTTNAAWIALIEARLNGQQNSRGPFRYSKSSDPTSRFPQTSNVPCFIAKFSWRYSSKSVNTISFGLDLWVGQ